MRRRPLIAILLPLLLGIILADCFEITSLTTWSLIGLFSLVFAAAIAETSKAPGVTILLTIGLVFLGISIYGASYFEADRLYPRLRSLEKIEGKVVSYPKQIGEESEFILRPESYEGRIKVFLSDKNNQEPSYGDHLSLKGNLTIPPKLPNFDYREFLRKRKIWGILYQGKITDSTTKDTNLLFSLGWNTRRLISKRIRNLLPDRGHFLEALLFGNREGLSDDLTRSFTETGLAHLLAASGLHLGILLGAVWGILLLFRVQKKRIYLLSFPIILLYLTLVGFKLPTSRAVIIYTFVGAHLYLHRSGFILEDWYDSLQTLAGAAIILILIRPEAIFSTGFQLSFSATFALAIFFRPIKKTLDVFPDYLTGIMAASLAAQLGVSPVLAVHFRHIHPWTPIVNLVAIPLVTATLYLGIIVLVLGNIPLVSTFLILTLGKLIELFQWTLSRLSTVPLAQIDLPQISPLAVVSYLIIIYWLKRKVAGRERIKERLKKSS